MKVNYQNIYEKLGYLFYSIASADNRIHPSEIEKLKSMVAREWLPLEDSIDKYGTDAGHYISISFDYLMSEGISPQDAYGVFADYFQEHAAAFSKELRKKITMTATAIAAAFADRNKNEKKYIDQLHRLLK